MKKTIIILSGIIILMLVGCENFLDLEPLDKPNSETFLSNETEVIMGVNACYRYLDPGENWVSHSWQRDLVNLEDAGQDRMSAYFRPFRDGILDPTEARITLYYQQHYEGVSRCHIVIAGMEAAKGSMEAAGKLDLYNRLQAEARVIRALCYYNLVSKYGDIPFTTNQLEMQEYAELERTPEDEVYAFILGEIEDAVQYLPKSYGGGDFGRITSGAAYAVGARAALYRAFFHNGEAVTPDPGYLQKVKDYTQEIIDGGQYALWYDPDDPKESYKTLFTYKGENSSEMILQKEFNYAQGKSHDWMRSLGSRNLPSCYAATTPQEYLIATYEDTLGNTVDQSPYYNPKNPFPGRDPRLYQTVIIPRVEGDQDIQIVLNTKNGPVTLNGYNEVWPGTRYPDAFVEGFMREYKTLLKPWGDAVGKDYDNWNWYTDSEGYDVMVNNQDGTNTYSSRTGYLTWKYFDINDFPNNQVNSSLNFMLIRYADVLLMNAEARIELNDNLNQAAEYMNMVRARGYGMQLEEYIIHSSAITIFDQASLRVILRRERKVELCHEGLRYDDLKRYGASVKALTMDVVGRPKFWHLEAATNIPQIDENAVVSLPWLEGIDGNSPDQPNRWWKKSFYKDYYDRWPIPQTEFDNGKALGPEDQNPGYTGG